MGILHKWLTDMSARWLSYMFMFCFVFGGGERGEWASKTLCLRFVLGGVGDKTKKGLMVRFPQQNLESGNIVGLWQGNRFPPTLGCHYSLTSLALLRLAFSTFGKQLHLARRMLFRLPRIAAWVQKREGGGGRYLRRGLVWSIVFVLGSGSVPVDRQATVGPFSTRGTGQLKGCTR